MFDPEKIYLASDDALKLFGKASTMANWRSQGTGPAFVKLGGRVGYRGEDLNDWLRRRTVQPQEAAAA